MKHVIHTQNIQIDGKDYTFEEAQEIYEELKDIFGSKIYYPPDVIPWKQVEPGIGYPPTVVMYGCLPPDSNISYEVKNDKNTKT